MVRQFQTADASQPNPVAWKQVRLVEVSQYGQLPYLQITMLDKLLKKRPSADAATAPSDKKTKAAKPSPKPVDPVSEEEWRARLAAAQNDDARLEIAKTAGALAIKQAAIEAMTTEAGLKSAEREFRSHDRRVYRDAKLRYEGKVTERLAREEATVLIATGKELLASDPIPANRFVDMDRAWQRIDLARLTAEMVDEYNAISNQLTVTLRARGDQQLTFKRWQSDAERARQEMIDGCLAVAQSGMDRDKLAKLYDHIESLRGQGALLPGAAEGEPATRVEAQQREIDHAQSQLESALQLARALDARLQFLDKVISDAADPGNESAALDDGGLNARWQALPIVSEPRVAKMLNDRFDAYRRTELSTRAAISQAAKAADDVAKKEELAAIETLVSAAESTLAAGQIVDSTASLAALDAQLKRKKVPQKFHARIERVRAEIGRLKGWQHWGGGRVREDLVVEAEDLAKAITDPKLNIKAQASAIEKLRERWKELDKLGGATNRELWTRFDGALKHAYLPVDAQLAKLKAARQENLQARTALLTKLGEEADRVLAATPPDWRQATRALDHFQTEWRKLGPVEHTVPHKAQKALLEKMQATQLRLEEPLAEARRVEAIKREKLVERAKALAADSNARDTIAKVRELQAEWQTHAKSLPLARQQENKLWGDFKTATDAVFKARDAISAARDQEFKAQLNARDALISQLQALDESTPPAEIRKTMNEVDAAWRKAGEVPRHLAAKIEGKYRAAKDRARDLVAGSAKRSWSKTCDLLDAKIALCVAIESGSATNIDDDWAALGTLPSAWETALNARRNGSASGDSAAAMLNLESALDIASPPAFQAARQQMKLLAMKRAIEARQAVVISSSDIERWVAEAISQSRPDAATSARLRAILNALRNRPL